MQTIQQIFKIDRWSNFDKVCSSLKKEVGETIFELTNPVQEKPGYITLNIPEGCSNRITKTINEVLPLQHVKDIYSINNQKWEVDA